MLSWSACVFSRSCSAVKRAHASASCARVNASSSFCSICSRRSSRCAANDASALAAASAAARSAARVFSSAARRRAWFLRSLASRSRIYSGAHVEACQRMLAPGTWGVVGNSACNTSTPITACRDGKYTERQPNVCIARDHHGVLVITLSSARWHRSSASRNLSCSSFASACAALPSLSPVVLHACNSASTCALVARFVSNSARSLIEQLNQQ